MRLQAIGTGLFASEGNLFLQAGHTNFEELIQVAGEDQQELQPLQQRIGLIQRLLQHADIELQLRQLAMDIQTAVIQPRHHIGRRALSRHFRYGYHLHCWRLYRQLVGGRGSAGTFGIHGFFLWAF